MWVPRRDGQPAPCTRVPLRSQRPVTRPGSRGAPVVVGVLRQDVSVSPQSTEPSPSPENTPDVPDEGVRRQWDDLARRRDTPGWRPSIVPTPVRDLVA